MFRPIRALKAMTAAGALALAAAPAPASAAQLLVEGDNAVAIDFTITAAPYYRYSFQEFSLQIAGLDGGESYEIMLYGSDSVLLGTMTPALNPVTEYSDPPVQAASRFDPGNSVNVSDIRAVLRATGGSSFTFDENFAASRVFGQLTPDGGPRRTGNRASQSTISAITLNSGGIPEPTTWALMIGGFGAVGAALRFRQRRPAVA